jgi:DDE family transposase
LSSDFGALWLRGIDRQSGLTERWAAAVRDKRPPSYIDHTLRALFAQRIYQIASGYADGNEAHSLRYAPMLKRSVERVPLDPPQHLASAPTFSRLAHQGTRTDRYRLTQAFVDHCMASYPEPPAAIVLDLDPTADPPHGQQACAFYNHHYQRYCSLPLLLFEGTSHALVAACLRPGKRPPGAEKAMLLVRLLAALRRHWPAPPILVRGESHCATPEVLAVMAHRRQMDFVCGLAGHPVLLRPAAPVMQEARRLFQQRTAVAQAYGAQLPPSTRVYEDFASAAASWGQPWRVIVQAEGMTAGDNPRFVVTS